MTILEALQAVNTYPIANTQIEVICIDRELTSGDTYTKTIGESQSYQLALADTCFYLGTAPSIVEQEVGINNAIAIKQQLLEFANNIYQQYGDPKFTGFTYGMKGENWNA